MDSSLLGCEERSWFCLVKVQEGRGLQGMAWEVSEAWARALAGMARLVWVDGMGAGRGMRQFAWENVEQVNRHTRRRQHSPVAAVIGDRPSHPCEWRQQSPVACVTGDQTLLS